jgi:hypothetical protein
MQKTTTLTGHLKETLILDQDGKPLPLTQGIHLTLKDNNLTIEIFFIPTQQKNTYIGHYTITQKEP